MIGFLKRCYLMFVVESITTNDDSRLKFVSISVSLFEKITDLYSFCYIRMKINKIVKEAVGKNAREDQTDKIYVTI